jgi:hypothetical protein
MLNADLLSIKNKEAKYLRGRGPLQLVFKKQIGKRELANNKGVEQLGLTP